MNPENTTLYYKDAKSDKVYKAALEKEGDLFLVNFAYGRRGSTLKTGTKTQSAIDYDKAKKIYDKLVLSKNAKGYMPVEDTTDYVYESSQEHTGIHCQLLNPIEEVALTDYLEDESWWAQEKMDGKRMLIKKDDVIAINRRGLSTGAPQSIIDAALAINHSFILDGEAINDTLYVFDILAFENEDLKDKSYQERYNVLLRLNFSKAIKLVVAHKSKEEKLKLTETLKQEGAEGIVLKKMDAAYKAGRLNSGGNQLKFKFYETASVIVEEQNDKRSVRMSMFNESGEEISVDNVTIPPNKEIPEVGKIIEVRYLYAYEGGSLYQPTYLNVRTDIEKSECTIDQLKFKKVME